jgi:chemotaxis-related protein WspB
MMLLLFTIGEDRFGLEVKHIVEIVPYIALKRVVGTPECVTGLFNYRQEVVPVIDLSKLLAGIPARKDLSTRIILVDYPVNDGRRHVVGLITEHATETVKFGPSAFSTSGIGIKNAEFVSSLAMDEKGMVQCISLERLLPTAVSDALFFSENEHKNIVGGIAR